MTSSASDDADADVGQEGENNVVVIGENPDWFGYTGALDPAERLVCLRGIEIQ